MFKRFNKQFYRSYDFYIFLLFILVVTSDFIDRDFGILSFSCSYSFLSMAIEPSGRLLEI